MPKSISDENFKRIQRVAEPLVDTLDSALARILDFYELAHGSGDPVHAVTVASSRQPPIQRPYQPYDPPNLTHTKVTFAQVRGKPLDAPSWNSVLDEMVGVAKKRFGKFSDLQSRASVHVVEGEKTEEGYHFLPDAGVSVQGQSANDAWRSIAQLARELDCSVQVSFFWRQKKEALRAGEGGLFVIEGRAK